VTPVRWITASFVGLVLVGFVSSFASRGQAERAAGARIAADLGTTGVHVLPERAEDPLSYPGSATVVPRAGFSVRTCRESSDQIDCFPWAGISPANVIGPFVVEVQWGAAGAGLSGGGTRTRYFTLFGLVIPMGDVGGWAS
jgi:hypothetical protein